MYIVRHYLVALTILFIPHICFASAEPVIAHQSSVTSNTSYASFSSSTEHELKRIGSHNSNTPYSLSEVEWSIVDHAVLRSYYMTIIQLIDIKVELANILHKNPATASRSQIKRAIQEVHENFKQKLRELLNTKSNQEMTSWLQAQSTLHLKDLATQLQAILDQETAPAKFFEFHAAAVKILNTRHANLNNAKLTRIEKTLLLAQKADNSQHRRALLSFSCFSLMAMTGGILYYIHHIKKQHKRNCLD